MKIKRVTSFTRKTKTASRVTLALFLSIISSAHAAEVIEVVGDDSAGSYTLTGLLGQSGYATDTDFDITVRQPSNKYGIGIANGLNDYQAWSNLITGDNEVRVTAGFATGLNSIVSEYANDSSTRILKTGDNIITVIGEARAVGISSESRKAGATSQVITDDNTIVATAIGSDSGGYTSVVASGISASHVLPVNSGDMSNITTKNNKITATATGGRIETSSGFSGIQAKASAFGIQVNGAGDITTKNNEITASAIGGYAKSLGNINAVAGATAIGIGSNTQSYVDNGHTVITTGDNVIQVTAKGGTAESLGTYNTANTDASAIGIQMNPYYSYAEENKAKTGKNEIRAIAIGGESTSNRVGSAAATAVGIYANGSGTGITATGAQSIYTEAIPGTVNNVTGKAYAYALLSAYGPIILDSQGEPVQLTGDIATRISRWGAGGSGNGGITLSLDHEDSYWRPRFQDQLADDSASVAATNGSFGNGSFTMENGGTLDLAWYANQNDYDFKNTSLTLTGNQINIYDGATFIINSDIVNNEADTITADTTATGTQYVRVVYDPSMYQNGIYQTGTVNGIALVLDFDGANGQGVTSQVDTALDVIEITPQMEGGYLKAITVVGPTGTTPEALKTVSDFYQHQLNILKLEGNNSFMRRMGDVRLEDPEKHKGVWARTFGGKLKSDGAYGRRSTQKYRGVEAGFDFAKEASNRRYFYGPLISYQKADSSYSRGSGDIESIALGGYASWVSDKGHYVDVVMKAVHLDTDYRLYSNRNDGGESERISADFGNWSYLMSGEYGYRHDLNSRTFIEPQAMLTLGRLNGKDYTASNGVRFQQEGINLAVGRLSLLYGANVGKEKNSNVYVKGSLIHDFSSSGGVRANYQGESRLIDTAGDTGTSFELNVGANLQLSKKNQLYFELTKSFGGDVETDWQANIGWQIRW